MAVKNKHFPGGAPDSDAEFMGVYPPGVRALDKYHWTPLAVIKKAARFLSGGGDVRILDIGSGVGKFCLAGAFHAPEASYYGVEQRKWLIDCAEGVREKMGLKNVSFIHGNFTQIDFRYYDHFYFYNAFYENLTGTDKIDHSIEYSEELFDYYNRYLFRQLQRKPKGTRLCTLCSLEYEVPPDFQVVGVDGGEMLKFWVKV
ncbi:MAG: methyltransferase domain-containing protein [Bacteroidetes bacterium]|nr:methyltransferase domain-containing protein [Bacteroidota bacterium]